jgi:nitrate reductase NapE component
MKPGILFLLLFFLVQISTFAQPAPTSSAEETMSVDAPQFIVKMAPHSAFKNFVKETKVIFDPLWKLAILFGSVFLIWGHADRMKEATNRGGEDRNDQLMKTVLLFVLMFIGGDMLQFTASCMDEAPEQIGAKTSVGAVALKLGDVLIENRKWADNLEKRPNAATPDGGADALKTAEGQMQAAMADDTKIDGNSSGWVDRAINKLKIMLTRFYVTAMRIIVGYITWQIVMIAMGAAMLLMWFIEGIRFVSIVVGSVFLPLFFGYLSIRSMTGVGKKYIISMIGLTLWPLGWALGHILTVELFRSMVDMMAPSASSIGSDGKIAQTFDSMSMMPMLTGVIILVGTVGLVIWVFVVTFGAPKLIANTLTAGAEFTSSLLSKSAAGTVVVAAMAGMAAASGGAAAPGAGTAAAADSGGGGAGAGGGGGAMAPVWGGDGGGGSRAGGARTSALTASAMPELGVGRVAAVGSLPQLGNGNENDDDK